VSRRLERAFRKRLADGHKALIPFVTAGDPSPDWTVGVMHALVQGGADVIELGVPFSDPMADGPVIQESSERAIARGVDLEAVLEMVREFRQQDSDTPVVLMGYMNPIERFGAGKLAAAAGEAGVDGMLLVDCPPEEGAELREALAKAGIDPILLVAPTTDADRLERICSAAGGFIYYVSFKGITGANRLDASALAGPIAAIRDRSELPVAAGFGINDPQSAVAVSAHADGVVIGSALVKHLADCASAESASERARDFIASVRQALDNGRSA
jgi:tryptophan synthase alpha chain